MGQQPARFWEYEVVSLTIAILTEEKLRPEVRAERRLLFMNDHINEIS
jgi:hypothetical protein